MQNQWKLQDAKNKLSQVIDKALEEGPQKVTRWGEETAVILSMKDYEKLTKTKTGLVEFFNTSPLRGVDLDLERSRESGRAIDL